MAAEMMCAAFAGHARAEVRLALVIGNKDYTSLPALLNTVNDARLISEKLKQDGFDVDPRENLKKSEMITAVRDFARRVEHARASGQDPVALIYYAGHGVQDDRQLNHIMGVDADVKSQVDLPTEALSIETIRKTLDQAAPRIVFLIFDACRDTIPTRGVSRGLGPEVAVPNGYLIAFSTEPGQSADDGPPGGNSPFALALAQNLEVPNLEATQMFRRVFVQVADATRASRHQSPWYIPRIEVDFYFRGGGGAPAPSPTPHPPPHTVSPSFDCEIEYGRAVVAGTAETYEDWLKRCPSNPRQSNVLQLLQQMREAELWKKVEQAASRDDQIRALEILLNAYPNGVYSGKAKERLRVLKEEEDRRNRPAPPPYKPPVIDPPASPRPHATRYENKDAPGGDLGAWLRNVPDADECERLCAINSDCVAYTMNIRRSICILKARVARLAPSPEPAVTGVFGERAGAFADAGPRVRYYDGFDAPGNDRGSWIKGVSARDCEQRCIADAGCAGYTYNHKRSTCIPKSAVGRMSTAAEPAVTGVVDRRGRP